MPQKDKREGKREPSRSPLSSVARACWGVVALFVMTLVIAWTLGVWGHLIVEFFLKGWEMISE